MKQKKAVEGSIKYRVSIRGEVSTSENRDVVKRQVMNLLDNGFWDMTLGITGSKYSLNVEAQHRDFDNYEGAKDLAKKIIEAGTWIISLKRVCA